MRARAAALVAAALVLSGCAAVPPPGMSEDDLAAFSARVFDRTWSNTGLPGDAPQVDPQPPATEEEGVFAVSECMRGAGVGNFSWGYSSDDGYRLAGVEGGSLDDPETQRAFYVCVATFVGQPDARGVLTTAQLDYIYDYYAAQLVPCMLDNGYTVSFAPTRLEFVSSGGRWSPYGEVPSPIGGGPRTALAALCGPELPAL